MVGWGRGRGQIIRCSSRGGICCCYLWLSFCVILWCTGRWSDYPQEHCCDSRHWRHAASALSRQYVNNNNNNNNNSHASVYGAVIMTQSHCESSRGSSDECRLSAGWPPTLRPSESTWAVSPLKIGSYHPHPPYVVAYVGLPHWSIDVEWIVAEWLAHQTVVDR